MTREYTTTKTTKVVVFGKNGYWYACYTATNTVGCFSDREYMDNNLKANGYFKLTINGNIEFWGN